MKKRCDRIVKKNALERNNPDLVKWWLDLFECIDEDQAIPDIQLRSFLVKLIPERVLVELEGVLQLRKRKYKFGDTESHTETPERKKTEVRPEKVRSSQFCEPATSNTNAVEEERLRVCRESLLSGYIPPRVNPYVRFFRSKPHVAAVWRERPPVGFNELTIEAKAELISKQIAKDFARAAHRILLAEELDEEDDEHQQVISAKEIMEMFKIGAQSFSYLKVCPRIMHHVTDQIAIHNRVPEQSRTTCLKREIRRDYKASKKVTKIFAFGGRLPYDMQVKPAQKEERWFHWVTPDKYHEDLRTMASVWQGITHLKSTQEFCKYLNDTGMKNPPEYLANCGLIRDRRRSELSGFSNVSDTSVPTEIPATEKTILEAHIEIKKTSMDQSQQYSLISDRELERIIAKEGDVFTKESIV